MRSLRGARHAVLKTLYSRVYQIGDEWFSCFLRNLKKRTSVVLRLIDVMVLIVKPTPELVVFFKHEL